MNREDFIEGFLWGASFGRKYPIYARPEWYPDFDTAARNQAEYEWECYSEESPPSPGTSGDEE